MAVGTLAGTATAPSPAAAWSNGPCPTSSGVTIVVDFTAFGAGVVTRCAPGTPRNGFEVLAGAGFSVEQVTTMQGFVCRIDGLPGPPEQCVTTPAPGTSWSYWHAERGGTWTYNPVGAGGSRPTQGSVEGWAFATRSTPAPPTLSPPAPPTASTPPTAPTPLPTPTRTTAPTVRPVTPPPAQTTAPMPTATLIAASVAATTTQPSQSPSAIPAGTATATTAPPAATPPAATPQPSGPGPLGTALGAGMVVIVGGAALVVRARARTGHG